MFYIYLDFINKKQTHDAEVRRLAKALANLHIPIWVYFLSRILGQFVSAFLM